MRRTDCGSYSATTAPEVPYGVISLLTGREATAMLAPILLAPH